MFDWKAAAILDGCLGWFSSFIFLVSSLVLSVLFFVFSIKTVFLHKKKEELLSLHLF